MSGTQNTDNIWSTLEENLALLIGFLTGDKNDGFKFSEFSDLANRENIMNLYYASVSHDPLTAVEELYINSQEAADRKELVHLSFMDVISGGDNEMIGGVLARMTDTLNTLKTNNINLERIRLDAVYNDLMDFEVLSADEINNAGSAKGGQNNQANSAPAPIATPLKEAMKYGDFLGQIAANSAQIGQTGIGGDQSGNALNNPQPAPNQEAAPIQPPQQTLSSLDANADEFDRRFR